MDNCIILRCSRVESTCFNCANCLISWFVLLTCLTRPNNYQLNSAMLQIATNRVLVATSQMRSSRFRANQRRSLVLRAHTLRVLFLCGNLVWLLCHQGRTITFLDSKYHKRTLGYVAHYHDLRRRRSKAYSPPDLEGRLWHTSELCFYDMSCRIIGNQLSWREATS